MTKRGADRLQRAATLWVDAQKDFERRFGTRRATNLRDLLGEVVTCDLGTPSEAVTKRERARGL